MTFLSEEKKIIFIHIPKTAGMSVTKMLGEELDNCEWFRDGKDGFHSTAYEVKQKLGTQWERYFSFAVSRNPYERLVSAYVYGLKVYGSNAREKMRSFSLFCKNLDYFLNRPQYAIYRPQTEFLVDKKFNLLVNKIVRLEELKAGLLSIAKERGFECRDFITTNLSEHRPWREYYSSVEKKIVSEKYRCDFEMLKYPFFFDDKEGVPFLEKRDGSRKRVLSRLNYISVKIFFEKNFYGFLLIVRCFKKHFLHL